MNKTLRAWAIEVFNDDQPWWQFHEAYIDRDYARDRLKNLKQLHSPEMKFRLRKYVPEGK